MQQGAHAPARSAFAWADDLPRYDFGPGHPMAPIRLSLTRDLIQALAIPGLTEVDPAPVDAAVLATVHDPAFIAAVERAARGELPQERAEAFGLGSQDNPVFPEMHEAACRIVGSTLAATQAVWSGEVSHGLSIAGGMHHAMPGRASGFCVYNDVAVAIRWLQRHGARRVVYVDLDAHHGDGVQEVFWDDPNVLTISVHESPLTLFPGTGYASETGGAGAEGSAVNVTLPARTAGDAWLRAVEAIVPPLVAAFAPDVVVSQHGCDAHGSDQLTNLRVSVEHQLVAAEMVRDLAAQHAGGRWIATGGGGYTVVEVVPRVWAGLAAISAGGAPDLARRLPERWRGAVENRLRLPAPEYWGDGVPVTLVPFSSGFDPDDEVDRAIMATRNAVFPAHGIDPSY